MTPLSLLGLINILSLFLSLFLFSELDFEIVAANIKNAIETPFLPV